MEKTPTGAGFALAPCMHLLRTRRFAPLFWTQLLGALNDNLFKSALVGTLTFGVMARSGAELDTLVNLATVALVAPFFFFSAIAGELADAVDKARLARALKLAEIGVMAVAGVGFWLQSMPILFVALALMGTQSAFFGPVKYAVLPQHLKSSELVAGNALVESATFVAIVIGTLAGTLLVGVSGGVSMVSVALLVIAVLGSVSARALPAAPSSNPRSAREAFRPFRSMRNTLRAAASPSIRGSIAGVSAFWLLGAVVLGQLPRFALNLGGGEGKLALLLTTFSIGIALGSFFAERVARRFGPLADGTVGFAALGLALGILCLGLELPTIGLLASLFGVGVAGGLFVVPLYAAMQRDADEDKRARVVAANNLANAAFMVVGAGYAAVRLGYGAEVSSVFVELSVFAAIVAAVALFATAKSAVHLLMRGLVRLMYRVELSGVDHVPSSGPVVLVANHQSFVDAFVIGALINRPMRFVMDHRMANLPVLRHFFRFAGAIPIAGRKDNSQILKAALESIDQALARGEAVAIFPEGKCTRDGDVDVFRPGIERILARRPAPVVPVALSGLFGSFFSYAHGHPMTTRPRRFRARIQVNIVAPRQEPVVAEGLRDVVASLVNRPTNDSGTADALVA